MAAAAPLVGLAMIGVCHVLALLHILELDCLRGSARCNIAGYVIRASKPPADVDFQRQVYRFNMRMPSRFG